MRKYPPNVSGRVDEFQITEDGKGVYGIRQISPEATRDCFDFRDLPEEGLTEEEARLRIIDYQEGRFPVPTWRTAIGKKLER